MPGVGATMRTGKPKVLLEPIYRPMERLFTPEDLRRLRAAANVVWAVQGEIPAKELEKHRDAAAIICGWWHHGSPAMFPKLQGVFEVGGNLPSPQYLDYDECFRRGITVASCAPAFGPAVAELALALTLACSRTVVETDRAFRRGNERWQFEANEESFMLFDQTVGFIGFGGLARNLKPLLDPFGVKVLAYDPWLKPSYLRAQGAEPCGLDALLRRARVIYVLAIPSPKNRGLLARRRLSLIRRDATVILISRSHLVDFDALTDMVRRKRFRAGIDVYPKEPLPKSHPIRRAPWAVLSSHKAGAMFEAMHTIGRWTVDDVLAVLKGRKATHMQVAAPKFVAHFKTGR